MNRRRTALGITGKASPARLSSVRLLFTAFMLLAFALQSYAVQTHIHEQLNLPVLAHGTAAKGAAANSVTPHSGAHAKKPALPVKDAPDDCPLCQLLYGGQYVAPDALVFFLPLISVRVLETELGALPRYDAVSHSWRGRAPPRL
jgi:hypothetical protein